MSGLLPSTETSRRFVHRPGLPISIAAALGVLAEFLVDPMTPVVPPPDLSDNKPPGD